MDPNSDPSGSASPDSGLPDSGSPNSGGPARRRARTKAQNREIILAAARKVFAERGFAAVTVRDVIGATPLASGTFYNYFKSKEEVYQALGDEVAVLVRPALRDARRAAATAESFLDAAFRGFLGAAVEHGARFAPRPAGSLRLRMDSPEVVAGIAELRADIEDAMARGVLPLLDAGHLTAAMVGLGFELSHGLNGPEAADGAARFATSLMLNGLNGPST